MIRWSLWLLAAALACAQADDEYRYKSPLPAGTAYRFETFDDPEWFAEKWVKSEAEKESEAGVLKYDGEYAIEAPSDENHIKGDLGLVLKTKARHYALSTQLSRPFLFDHRPLIVQYEVLFQNGMECGGAYLKLLMLPDDKTVEQMQAHFNDRTPYSIMFGPDKCGTVYKLQLIFQHKNPKTGLFEEKHWKSTIAAGGAMNGKFLDVFNDKKPHLYTLIFSPDNTFEILIDGRSEAKGSLLEDFDPPVNPPKTIEDFNDSKPEDWDEREKIPDPEAQKPLDWNEDEPKEIEDPNAEKPIGWLDDETALIPDPEAEQPADWDEDMDGVWEAPLVDNPKCKDVGCGEWKAPMIPNPKYKGKWRPPMVDNPAYKGKWKPRTIPNPDYFEDLNPFRLEPVVAVGFELWSMSDGILFDNLLIAEDRAVAEQFGEDGFQTKRRMLNKNQASLFAWVVDMSTQYPWLWAVYVLVVGVPVALLISYCCMPKTVGHEATARSKKSDLEEEPQNGVDPLDKVDEEIEDVGGDEEPEDAEASDTQAQGDEVEETVGDKGEQEKPESDQQPQGSPKEEGAGEAVKSTTRKRKGIRKE